MIGIIGLSDIWIVFFGDLGLDICLEGIEKLINICIYGEILKIIVWYVDWLYMLNIWF